MLTQEFLRQALIRIVGPVHVFEDEAYSLSFIGADTCRKFDNVLRILDRYHRFGRAHPANETGGESACSDIMETKQ